MTLSFSQKWPKSMPPEYLGKPNHFVKKIVFGLLIDNRISPAKASELLGIPISIIRDEIQQNSYSPKFHTFRADSKDRWKVGMKIHPVINNRTKNRLQFAPEIEVKGIQEIEITICSIRSDGKVGSAMIWIDGDYYCSYQSNNANPGNINTIVRNDGFDSVEQFFAWFNKDFTGKIIHWTDFKY